MSRRTTLYAAFSGSVPMLNVYDFNKKRLEMLMSDRKANGDAFPDEHLVRITVEYYNGILRKHGFPEINT